MYGGAFRALGLCLDRECPGLESRDAALIWDKDTELESLPLGWLAKSPLGRSKAKEMVLGLLGRTISEWEEQTDPQRLTRGQSCINSTLPGVAPKSVAGPRHLPWGPIHSWYKVPSAYDSNSTPRSQHPSPSRASGSPPPSYPSSPIQQEGPEVTGQCPRLHDPRSRCSVLIVWSRSKEREEMLMGFHSL